MTRLCKNCGFENQDDYDFCAKCGTPLVEGLKPRQFKVYRAQGSVLCDITTFLQSLSLRRHNGWNSAFRLSIHTGLVCRTAPYRPR